MAHGARPIGAFLGAILGGLYGVEICLVAAVLGFLLQALVIILSPAVCLRQRPAAATP